MSSVQLVHLRRKAAYYRHDAPDWVRNVWNRPESFDWFIKSHRDALTERGAVVKLGRDFFINAKVFPKSAESLLGLKPVTTASEVAA